MQTPGDAVTDATGMHGGIGTGHGMLIGKPAPPPSAPGERVLVPRNNAGNNAHVFFARTVFPVVIRFARGPSHKGVAIRSTGLAGRPHVGPLSLHVVAPDVDVATEHP